MQTLIRPDLALPAPYKSWWLRFRQSTNEADLIAQILADFLAQEATSSKTSSPWRLIDVGCGDAVLVAKILRSLHASGKHAPMAVDLIDPILTPEAVSTCREALASGLVAPWPTDLGRFLLSPRHDAPLHSSLSLVVHSGYYLEDGDLDEICLNRSSLGSLFVVNSANSFIGDIWALVNKPMFEELERIGQWLRSRGQLILRTDASLRLPRSPELGFREVLSFLALKEFGGLPIGIRKEMLDIIEKYRASEEYVGFGLDFFYIPPRE